MDIAFASIQELQAALAQGATTSLEIVTTLRARIQKMDPDVHAFIELFDEALEEARDWDAKRAAGNDLPLLAGIPIAIKDCILMKDHNATAGSGVLQGYVASYDATVVARLKAAGAIVIGRTNMDEFAMGSSTENSFYGPTNNPWDASRVPGGSSGGSAAAVAAGFVPVALGSDTGGSVRQPASLCGVVGVKPTYGRVSRFGLIALASSLDQIGVFARCVEDAALVLEVIQGKDPQDATSVSSTVIVSELLTPKAKGLRIGIPKEYFVEGMDPAVSAAVKEVVEVYRNAGAEIKEVSLPHTKYALAAYYILMPSEASSNLARFDGIRYQSSAASDTLLDRYKQTRGRGFGKEAKRRILLGTYALSAGYADAYYKKSLQVRAKVREDFDKAFQEVDLLLTPTSPCVAWALGEKFDDPLAMYLADIYTISINLAGLPGISLPCGFEGALPIGVQLIGKPFGELALFEAAAFYQSATDWHTKHPA